MIINYGDKDQRFAEILQAVSVNDDLKSYSNRLGVGMSLIVPSFEEWGAPIG